MKSTCAVLLCLAAAVGTAAESATPAELAIRKAQEKITQHPDHYPYYNELAMAYARRARETSDVSYYNRAEETLQRSLTISPGNFEALKTITWLQLGLHEFAKARESAAVLRSKVPDDATVYGYIVDANAELGNYQEAVEAAQWMLNLRPGNVAGLARAGYLRELHGDLDGAIEAMQMAYDATPYSEFEDRAWLLTQISKLYLASGDSGKAETYATGALGVFPEYHYALGALAQVRMRQGKFDEAVALLGKRYNAAPHAENVYALAQALDHAGRSAEAKEAYARFEAAALRESKLPDNANHELIAYYVDVARRPEKAIELARQELARRHDIYTLDCYAWALAAAGRRAEARQQIEKALATGTKDPVILAHAEAITKAL